MRLLPFKKYKQLADSIRKKEVKSEDEKELTDEEYREILAQHEAETEG